MSGFAQNTTTATSITRFIDSYTGSGDDSDDGGDGGDGGSVVAEETFTVWVNKLDP